MMSANFQTPPLPRCHYLGRNRNRPRQNRSAAVRRCLQTRRYLAPHPRKPARSGLLSVFALVVLHLGV